MRGILCLRRWIPLIVMSLVFLYLRRVQMNQIIQIRTRQYYQIRGSMIKKIHRIDAVSERQYDKEKPSSYIINAV